MVMNGRMFVITGVLGSLLGSLLAPAAFAQEEGQLAAATSKISAQAQFELLPAGSAAMSAGGVSVSTDTAVAYGVTAMLDYAVTPYLSIGIAPRLVLNVKSDSSDGMNGAVSAGKEIDLRARVVGHVPVAPRVEAYASLAPGYAFLTGGDDGTNNPSGFAIAGAVGMTYDLTPRMFVGAEIGYQRAFTTTEVSVLGQKMDVDLDLSYMHIGFGAGTRF